MNKLSVIKKEKSEERKKIIKNKFKYFLLYENKKTKETSKIRVKKIIKEIMKEIIQQCTYKDLTEQEKWIYYLVGIFHALAYDVTALLDARGISITEVKKLLIEVVCECKELLYNWIRIENDEEKFEP